VLVRGGLPLIPGAGGFEVRDRAFGEREERPNVVVIVTDDQDKRSVRAMSKVRRKLVAEGTTFENFYGTFPLCCPYRATLLTGQYAHNHGVLSNRGDNGGYEAFDDRSTLPTWLRKEGYRTGWVGKYLNGYGKRDNDPEAVPPGWDEWYAPVGKTESRMFDFGLNENGRVRRYGDRERDYQTDVLARKGVGFIRESADDPRPFLMVLATSAPHGEGQRGGYPNPRPAPRHRGSFDDERLPRPPSFNERNASDKPAFVSDKSRLGPERVGDLERRYRSRLESLLAVDDAVGRVVRALNKTDQLRNTLVVFTSDGGYLLGEHRLKAKPYLYEEAAKVPLIVRGPGIPSGERREQVTGNVDLAPTILDVAGARSGRQMDGRSLIRFARDPEFGVDREVLLELRSPRPPRRSAGVRWGHYVYLERPDGEEELYDLRSDPLQLHNRHEDSALRAVRDRLASRLDEVRECAGKDCP
jgi:arylsulfatase A-like enzyme